MVSLKSENCFAHILLKAPGYLLEIRRGVAGTFRNGPRSIWKGHEGRAPRRRQERAAPVDRGQSRQRLHRVSQQK